MAALCTAFCGGAHAVRTAGVQTGHGHELTAGSVPATRVLAHSLQRLAPLGNASPHKQASWSLEGEGGERERQEVIEAARKLLLHIPGRRLKVEQP